MSDIVHFHVSDLESIVRKMKSKGLDVACVIPLDPDPEDDYTGGLAFEAVSSVHPSTVYDVGELDDDSSLSTRFSSLPHTNMI